MKRIILCLAMGVGLIVACSETQAVTTAAGLSGTYDLTIVGRYVFVTSSDRNELRVLDLEADPRDFVRAPNPLEALSIPVLERPTYLTRDVYYRVVDAAEDQPRGEEVFGPYVYARSDGAQQISIVAAGVSDERNLRELHRLGGPREDGSSSPLGYVTAFAARGPGRGTESILYYATQEASVATLWRQTLPGPDSLNPNSTLPARTSVRVLPGETVAALLVLPSDRPTSDNPSEQEYVVVSTRGTQGGTGRTFRLDASNPQAPLVTYAFPAPVRLLATHPVVANTDWEGDMERDDPEDEDPTNRIAGCGIDAYQPDLSNPNSTTVAKPARSTLWAGEYVFGVLDESTCGGAVACSGVIAVDSVTGQVPVDASGAQMLPIRVTSGLPTGLTLIKDARLYTRCADAAENHVIPRPLVGMVPTSDGQISFFDAVKLRPFDLNAGGPSIPSITVIGPLGQDKTPALPPEGQPIPPPLVLTEVRNGATRSDTYRMIYEGLLPPPRRRAFSAATNCPPPGSKCTFEVGSMQETRFLLANDLIVLDGGQADVCELPVTLKDESTPAQVKLETGALPENCTSHTRFSVRASAASGAPFVVTSDSRGYEGRVAVSQTLEVAGNYTFHPGGFNSTVPPFQVRLTLRATVNPLERGDQYVVAVSSGFSPYIFAPDVGNLSSGLSSFRLPGPVSYTRVGEATLAYIAYPSADGILQVNLASL
ncbi:MAG TPA: hypothetical protein VF815_40030, partial [Myxococcaceae bacterium]